ncbi:MAG TPA: hypothetical protein VJC03_05955 [bacterium]|nr:hypothetical protein [bacterium]
MRDHLVKKGADASKINIAGWGEEKPLASNRTRAGRTLNRRVEVIILKERISEDTR